MEPIDKVKWAENEVKIALGNDTSKDDYIHHIYDIVLNAYRQIATDCGDNIGTMLSVELELSKILNGNPLSPIEDIPEIWTKTNSKAEDYIEYQCTRKPLFFKYVNTNGKIKYSDYSRFTCKESYNEAKGHIYTQVCEILDLLFPIKMPYKNDNYYTVITESFYSTSYELNLLGVYEVKDKYGIVTPIMKFYGINRMDNKLKEINVETYNVRRLDYYNRWYHNMNGTYYLVVMKKGYPEPQLLSVDTYLDMDPGIREAQINVIGEKIIGGDSLSDEYLINSSRLRDELYRRKTTSKLAKKKEKDDHQSLRDILLSLPNSRKGEK